MIVHDLEDRVSNLTADLENVSTTRLKKFVLSVVDLELLSSVNKSLNIILLIGVSRKAVVKFAVILQSFS